MASRAASSARPRPRPTPACREILARGSRASLESRLVESLFFSQPVDTVCAADARPRRPPATSSRRFSGALECVKRPIVTQEPCTYCARISTVYRERDARDVSGRSVARPARRARRRRRRARGSRPRARPRERARTREPRARDRRERESTRARRFRRRIEDAIDRSKIFPQPALAETARATRARARTRARRDAVDDAESNGFAERDRGDRGGRRGASAGREAGDGGGDGERRGERGGRRVVAQGDAVERAKAIVGAGGEE